LEGPSRLELLSGKSARLVRGKLTARVPPSFVGFEILSPQGKIIDLGTEFGVAVFEKGATEVIVFKGSVEAHAVFTHPAEAWSLPEHQAARSAEGRVVIPPAEPAADQFVRAIVPPPVIVPRTLRVTFERTAEGGLRDVQGLATGLAHR